MLLEYFMRFSLVYQIYQWNDVYGWPKSHLSPQNSRMRMYTTTGKRRDWRWKSKSMFSQYFFFIRWEHPFGKRKKFEYVIRTCPSGTIIARYCTSSLSACTCLLVWIDRFPRRGLRYLWRAAARQAIMDGQCSIDTARLEIMARTRNAVWRSLNEQPNRIRLENRRAARISAWFGLPWFSRSPFRVGLN